VLSDLNPQQQEAVTRTDGPVLIIAGAGSGKTRVITHRIAYLVRTHNVDPTAILAVTFTNNAAREMAERAAELAPEITGRTRISTFHSTCAWLLRRHQEKLGFTSPFTIYDDDDKKRLLKNIIKSLTDKNMFTAASAAIYISTTKNAFIRSESFADSVDYFPGREIMAEIYRRYEEALMASCALDFDDLLIKTVRLLENDTALRDFYSAHWRYIMVDEYQDTNEAQYRLTNVLAAKHRNICVVGDDDQSIYSWRGARIQNILSFKDDYPNAFIVRLEQNYRSTQNILSAASAMIAHNSARMEKKLWTDSNEGSALILNETKDAFSEARCIQHMIHSFLREGFTLEDIAVFYRINAQSRVFEEVFRSAELTYRIIGGVTFYERAEVKDVLAYLRLLVNPNDSAALYRIINTPRRGIGEKSINAIIAALNNGQQTLYDITQTQTGLSARVWKSFEQFRSIIRLFSDRIDENNIHLLAAQLIEKVGYDNFIVVQDEAKNENRLENIKELINSMMLFQERHPNATLREYLDESALITDDNRTDDNADAVSLMTLHNAKGLEYPIVFITGIEEGLLPLTRKGDTDIEEERRLMYVGMTRARKHCILSYALQRRNWERTISNMPSPFLAELPPETLIYYSNGIPLEGTSWAASQDTSYTNQSEKNNDECFPVTDADFSDDINQEMSYTLNVAIGDFVLHPSYGRCRIIGIEGSGDDTMLHVTTKTGRKMKFFLKYTELERCF